MQKSLVAIQDVHRREVDEIMEQIGRYSEKTGDCREDSQLQGIQDELEEFKHIVMQEENKEKDKFMGQLAILERLQAEREELAKEVGRHRKMDSNLSK